MQFPGYQIETTDDNRIRVSLHMIDETELIYDDPEAREMISAKNLFSEQELNEPIIEEPHPMVWGDDIYIQGRFIVDALCRVYLQIDPNAKNRDAIEQLAKRLLNDEIDVPNVEDISHICSGDDCYLSTWNEVEQFVHWIKSRGPY
jgi:hypothetical protein